MKSIAKSPHANSVNLCKLTPGFVLHLLFSNRSKPEFMILKVFGLHILQLVALDNENIAKIFRAFLIFTGYI